MVGSASGIGNLQAQARLNVHDNADHSVFIISFPASRLRNVHALINYSRDGQQFIREEAAECMSERKSAKSGDGTPRFAGNERNSGIRVVRDRFILPDTI